MPPMLSLCLCRPRIVRGLSDDPGTVVKRIWDRSCTGEDDEPLDGRPEEAQYGVGDDRWISDVGLCSVHGRAYFPLNSGIKRIAVCCADDVTPAAPPKMACVI